MAVKITKTQLRKIIAEEVKRASKSSSRRRLRESPMDSMGMDPMDSMGMDSMDSMDSPDVDDHCVYDDFDPYDTMYWDPDGTGVNDIADMEYAAHRHGLSWEESRAGQTTVSGPVDQVHAFLDEINRLAGRRGPSIESLLQNFCH